jgi:hypothetical protein
MGVFTVPKGAFHPLFLLYTIYTVDDEPTGALATINTLLVTLVNRSQILNVETYGKKQFRIYEAAQRQL